MTRRHLFKTPQNGCNPLLIYSNSLKPPDGAEFICKDKPLDCHIVSGAYSVPIDTLICTDIEFNKTFIVHKLIEEALHTVGANVIRN